MKLAASREHRHVFNCVHGFELFYTQRITQIYCKALQPIRVHLKLHELEIS